MFSCSRTGTARTSGRRSRSRATTGTAPVEFLEQNVIGAGVVGGGVDHNRHRFVVPEPRALADMTLAEIDAAVCWNYHLDEPHSEKDKILLRAALGLPKDGYLT